MRGLSWASVTLSKPLSDIVERSKLCGRRGGVLVLVSSTLAPARRPSPRGSIEHHSARTPVVRLMAGDVFRSGKELD
jgi:hypothetical protein